MEIGICNKSTKKLSNQLKWDGVRGRSNLLFKFSMKNLSSLNQIQIQTLDTTFHLHDEDRPRRERNGRKLGFTLRMNERRGRGRREHFGGRVKFKFFKKVMQKEKLDLNKMEDEKSFGKLNPKEVGSKQTEDSQLIKI